MIPGNPVGAGRPRVTRFGTFYPKSTKLWIKTATPLIRAAWRGAPMEAPLAVDVVGVKKRPRWLCAKKYPDGRILRCVKPDDDNVRKIALDVLTKAGVYKDDCYVAAPGPDGGAFFAARDEVPGVEIVVGLILGHVWADVKELHPALT